MAALISYVPLYRPAGFSSIPLLRHQHINPVRRSDLPAHPQDQSVILQFQKGPLAGLCTVPQRHGQLHNGKLARGQFWVWERRGLLAAPWWMVFGFSFLAGQSVQRWGQSALVSSRSSHYFTLMTSETLPSSLIES